MSDLLPQNVVIGSKVARLADIEERTRIEADFSCDEWAELSQVERDLWLVTIIHALRDEAERTFARA